MRLVYKYNINTCQELLNLCSISKNLYNQALYEVKENLKNNKFIFYNDLNKIMMNKYNLEGNINYKLLKAQVSQQILKILDKDIKSYFKSIKEYSKHKEKYKGNPKLPNYKKTYNQLIYTNQCSTIKNGYIHLSKTLKIPIPQWDKYSERLSHFNQIRIIPKRNNINIEIIYEYECQNEILDYNEYSSIDLGINNLITLVSMNNPLLISGKVIKTINQNFNKQLSKYQSIKDKQKIKKITNNIINLYEKRENRLKDLFHKLSRYIVKYLIKNKIGNIVIGYNKNWKDSISLGKKTNQKFIQIPYLKLLDYLKYKCQLVGINLIETEESYTSKCDALALEKIQKHEEYSGKRKKRGLFQSGINKLINADVNGSINIMRKVVNDSYINKIIDKGLLFNPIKVRNLYDLNLL
jgi:putative transposase